MSDLTHISQTDFYTFKNNLMNQKDQETFLEHICSCDYCSDQFATIMSEEIIEAPRDMKANLLKAAKRPEVQLAIKARETSKQLKLLIYSLKVGTATALALLILMLSMNFTDISPTSSLPKKSENGATSTINKDFITLTAVIRDNMNAFSNSMLEFSNNIIKTEVTNNDQKEK